MQRAYIALGSNLNTPLKQVEAAISAIQQLPQTQLCTVSPWYRSKAIGPGQQNDYINGVAAINTELSAPALLEQLQAIELSQGRLRLERWGPRTLDLDILLYGNNVLATATLSIPHPRMKERNFVLYPLLDIAADLVLPHGEVLADIIKNCPKTNLDLVDPSSSHTMGSSQQ